MDNEQSLSILTGHRSRLKERFFKSPNRTLPDYEILEMPPFNAIARRDTKTLAKALLNKFGSLIGVISADPVDLQAVPGVGYAVLVQFKLFLDAFTRCISPRHNIKNINVLDSWTSVINYCSLTMGF
ncbi:MAG: hypothetical protein MRQ07_03780 [Candidatus Midichloria sp.]|nr:hypothetical protein [Candidatus Midichloria sp.]